MKTLRLSAWCPGVFSSVLLLAPLWPSRAHSQTFVDLRDAGLDRIVGVGTAHGQPVVIGRPRYSTAGVGPVLRWTAARGTVDLAPPGIRYHYFQAEDISADAATIVGRSLGRENPNRESAYVWHIGESFTEIAWEIREAEFAAPSHLSADGRIAAGRGAGGAYRWSEAEGLSYIGGRFDEVPDKPLLWVEDLSHDGSVIVGTTVPTFYEFGEAARWTAATGVVTLGVLADSGADRSWASGVSADGSIVVGNSYRRGEDGYEYQEAFRWTDETGMAGLGFLENQYASYASFIAGDGSFILGTSGSELFYWTPEFGMQRLIEVLASEYGLAGALAGWRLQTIEALSADSRFMVGTGIGPDGRSGKWLVGLQLPAVPEPASFGLAAGAALLALLVLRRRRPAGASAGTTAATPAAAGI